jgi:hypothetical protein
VSSKFANTLSIVDPDPNGDGNLSDATIAGKMILNAGGCTKMDDTVTNYPGMGGQGVLALPLVYNGWVQQVPSGAAAELTCAQRNPIEPAKCAADAAAAAPAKQGLVEGAVSEVASTVSHATVPSTKVSGSESSRSATSDAAVTFPNPLPTPQPVGTPPAAPAATPAAKAPATELAQSPTSTSTDDTGQAVAVGAIVGALLVAWVGFGALARIRRRST